MQIENTQLHLGFEPVVTDSISSDNIHYAQFPSFLFSFMYKHCKSGTLLQDFC